MVLGKYGPSSSARDAAAGGEWTSFTHDHSNSRYQAGSTITADNVAALERAWSFRTREDVTSTPVVRDGRVYFADWGGNVYAVEVASGALVWQQKVAGAVSSTLLLSHGRVYVGIGPNKKTRVVALSQSTGKLLWSTRLHGTVHGAWSSPTEMNGLIYIGIASANREPMNDAAKAGSVFALDAKSGKLRWQVTTGGTGGGAGVWGSVVGDPERNAIYFGAGNAYSPFGTTKYSYSIVSLDAGTGQENWFYPAYTSWGTGGDLDFGSTPNLFSYVGTDGVAHDAVGLGSKDGTYYIVDRTNGALLQKYKVSNGGSSLGIFGAGGFIPDANAPEIFIPGRNAGGGVVSAVLPATKQISWQTDLVGDLFGSVAVVPGAVLVGDTSGTVYALFDRRRNGAQAAQAPKASEWEPVAGRSVRRRYRRRGLCPCSCRVRTETDERDLRLRAPVTGVHDAIARLWIVRRRSQGPSSMLLSTAIVRSDAG